MGEVEILRWIRLGDPAYSAAWLQEGQYAAAGTERGLTLFDMTGRRLLSYPRDRAKAAVPVHQIAITDGRDEDPSRSGIIYVGTRIGWLVRLLLEQTPAGFSYQVEKLYQTQNDIHTISVSSEGLVAVGHLAPGLAVLSTTGEILWRRHPDSGNATNGRFWAVSASPGEDAVLYVGSAGSETNVLAALDARTGTPLAGWRCSTGERVTALAALPGGGVAAIVVDDLYSIRLAVYPPNLEEPIWEHELPEIATAIAADPQQPMLAVGVGYEGQVIVMDTHSGQILASNTYLRTAINSLSLGGGRFLAAATEDGHLVILRYLPEKKEFGI